jgi:predicted metal-dependent hydrolase
VPWLDDLSNTHDLPFRTVTIRGQKTRWGSCSSKQTISLNYQLLLLDPQLVNCVLIHELCHTRHLHHGAAFWQLVEQLEPDHRALHQRLRQVWGRLPGWLS